MNEKNDNEFKQKLLETNKKIGEEIQQKIHEYLVKRVSINDLMHFEFEAQSLFIDHYQDFVKDVDKYLEVNVILNISQQVIGVFPKNLFTALLASGRYNGDILPKKIEEQNIYYDCVDNTSMTYDVDTNMLKYIRTH